MTYSIVGADTSTRQVGGAGTSCLSGDDVYVIYQGVPARGVVHAQARYNLDGRQRAAELLAIGQAPADIVVDITQASFDRSAAMRQYGVVDVLGQSAAYTGNGTTAYASDRQGSTGTFSYSVQGNILTSEAVLTQAQTAFEQTGCDLAERLMTALEAGARGGQGDSRCTPQGIPSDSAFLQVESPELGAGEYLSLRVQSSGRDSPLPQLRTKLEAWRSAHPCPPVPTNPHENAPSMQDDTTGCSCRSVVTPAHDASGLLLGGLLVVAWRRLKTQRISVARSTTGGINPRSPWTTAVTRADCAEQGPQPIRWSSRLST